MRRGLIAGGVLDHVNVPIVRAREFMNPLPLAIQELDGCNVLAKFKVSEAERRSRKRAAVVAEHLPAAASSSATDDKADGPSGDLQMLHRVIVARHVEIDVMASEDRPPLGLENPIVSMRAVAEEGVMAAADQPGGVRFIEFLRKPIDFRLPLCVIQCLAVAVEHQHCHHRMLGRQIHAIII